MAVPDSATEQALAWMVTLRSGQVTAPQRDAFAQWLARDPRHAEIWQALQARVQQPLGGLQALAQRSPGQMDEARRLLLVPRRRRAIQLAWAVGVGGLSVALLERQMPLDGLLADLGTHTAERQRFALADGSAVTLNARSSADRAGSGWRGFFLRHGEALVEAVADLAAFEARTPHGVLETAQAHFLVRTEADASEFTVLERSARLRAGDGSAHTLRAGESMRLDARRAQPMAAAEAPDADWVSGYLVANDLPLARVVARLQPYRSGLLQVADSAAALRVQGSFPLDDIDQALRALEDTLPLRVRRFGPWLTRIERRAA